MKRFTLLLAAVIAVGTSSLAVAQQQQLDGGQTSVLLDTTTLSSVGLDLSSVSADVIVPGELGADSVAFGINSRSDSPATTFLYEIVDLAPFSGTIEHQGSVFFNADAIEVGDFSIGFDGARASGANSGFFVESTVGITAILFDIETPSLVDAGATELRIEADLLVSSEFAAVLGDSNLTGVDVGDALVVGSASAVPEPSSMALVSGCVIAFVVRRRK